VLPGLVVVFDDEAPSGTLAIIDGLPAAPASAFAEGDFVTVTNVRAARDAATQGAA